MRKMAAFLKGEGPAEVLEWGLVCSLIVVGALAAVGSIAPKAADMWSDLSSMLPGVAR